MAEIMRGRTIATAAMIAVAVGGTIGNRLFGDRALAEKVNPGNVPGLAGAVALPGAAQTAKRFAACEDAALSEPDFGMEKVPEKIKKIKIPGVRWRRPPLIPYVNLEPVEANGRPCDDDLVQRIVTLFEKVDGEIYPVASVAAGNGQKGHFFSVQGSRGEICGSSVQAGVKVEATQDPVNGYEVPDLDNPGHQIARVYLSPPMQVACRPL